LGRSRTGSRPANLALTSVANGWRHYAKSTTSFPAGSSASVPVGECWIPHPLMDVACLHGISISGRLALSSLRPREKLRCIVVNSRPWGLIIVAVIAVAAATGSWALASPDPAIQVGAVAGESVPATGAETRPGAQSGALTQAQLIEAMIILEGQAIQASGIAVENGARPEVTALASDILSTQAQNVSQLRSWNRDWFGVESPAPAGAADEALRVPEEIAALGSSTAIDRDVLAVLIANHESVIGVANRLRSGTPRLELENRLRHAIAQQQERLDRMQEWRRVWFGQTTPPAP
jgi:uncharacterized protein (DUF305 family)